MTDKNYHIIQAVFLHDLENFVNEKIYEGWHPLGAPQILRGENGIVYNQAMIRNTHEMVIHNHVQEYSDEFDKQLAKAIGRKLP